MPGRLDDLDLDLNGDKLREECGVFGIMGNADAAAITVLGLHSLQHRGQEAAGIVTFDGANNQFHSERRPGLVGDNFSSEKMINRLPGAAAIGHVRYSTTGETVNRNIQPLFAELSAGGIAVAHNGNLTNARMVRKDLVSRGAIFQSTTDTEVIIHLMAVSRGTRVVDRLIDALKQVEGAYGLVVLTHKKLIGARDPLGIRPLVLGKMGDAYIFCSETCALDIIGAEFIREVEPGEIVVVTGDEVQSMKPFPQQPPRPCIFEFIYFARPDSIVRGKSVYEVRKNLGAELAKESPAEVDVVIPVPDSGTPAAIGYAEEAGVPFELGIIRNHYVGRSFIEPTQKLRDMRVKLKHNVNRSVVKGKRIILVDDSIVRGTTSKKIVKMMRDAGATEVHMRIASPPITHPDYYGIDTPNQDELMAAKHSLEKMARKLDVDSLAFISVDGLYRAMGEEQRNDVVPQFTDHCFTGDYPTRLLDQQEDSAQDHQLSLLAEIA